MPQIPTRPLEIFWRDLRIELLIPHAYRFFKPGRAACVSDRPQALPHVNLKA
jgi:hypothetical protein